MALKKVRKLKLIPMDRIVEMVNNSNGKYTKMARGFHGSRNDIRPSLNHWVDIGILSSKQIDQQTTIWQVVNYVIDDMQQLGVKALLQSKTDLEHWILHLSGKKITTKAKNPKIIVKIQSDYWKMIFAFQKVSEFYIKLLLQQEKEHDEDNLRYLKVMIRNTMKMINLNRKKLLANRPPHEVTYLEKALDSIPVFDTQFP
jgi:hypothetical protein